MPLYEYYCEKCDSVFEALKALRDSERAAPCPTCGREAERIMPTTFASMSFRQGYAQRVPYHHRSIRNETPQRTIALVKPKGDLKPNNAAKRSKKKIGRGQR